MKKMLSIIISGFMLLMLGGCGNTAGNADKTKQSAAPASTAPQASAASSVTADGKTLVAYFSYSGNTKSIAEKIAEKTGADIFVIDTTYDYPEEYNAVIEQAQQEQRENARPKLSAAVENMADFDTVFIGYPNWWGDMPMAVYSFLDEYDLSKKTVIPFCTHGGSGLSDTVSSIKNEEPNADVKDGLAIRDNALNSSDSAIDSWLSDNGFTM